MPQRLKSEYQVFRAEVKMAYAERFLVIENYTGELDPKKLGQLAGVFVENGETDSLAKRVNPYSLRFNEWGLPDFPVNRKTKLGKAECTGMESIYRLAKAGNKNIIWISPSGGRSKYEKSALVVGVVKSLENGVELECRGIPVNYDPDECLEIARRIMEWSGYEREDLKDPENLRENALAFVPAKNESWIDFLGRAIDLPEVWRAIRQNDELRRKRTIETVVTEVLGRVVAGIRIRDPVVVGARFEREMRKEGYGLMAGGAHGMSNEAVLGMRSSGAFNHIYNMGEVRAEVVNRNGQRYCSVCGVRLAEGVTVCPKCGLKLKLS